MSVASPRLYLLHPRNLLAKASTQLAEHCHFEILGDSCEVAFCGVSMHGLLFFCAKVGQGRKNENLAVSG